LDYKDIDGAEEISQRFFTLYLVADVDKKIALKVCEFCIRPGHGPDYQGL
jgi:hypothetical protein